MIHQHLTPVFTKHIPHEIEEGKVYISEEFEVAIHLCACGCKGKTVMPFTTDVTKMRNENTWLLTKTGHTVTFRDSIGNWNYPCRSHYFITYNKIEWC